MTIRYKKPKKTKTKIIKTTNRSPLSLKIGGLKKKGQISKAVIKAVVSKSSTTVSPVKLPPVSTNVVSEDCLVRLKL